jgi:hypothetical protein
VRISMASWPFVRNTRSGGRPMARDFTSLFNDLCKAGGWWCWCDESCTGGKGYSP